MIFCVSIFIFRLEPTVREQLDENDFRRCYGIFFESTIVKLLDQASFKVFSQQYKTQRCLKRFIIVEDFTDMDFTIWTNFFLRKYL